MAVICNDALFLISSYFDNLFVLKHVNRFLKSAISSKNISESFVDACKSNYIDQVKWFVALNPPKNVVNFALNRSYASGNINIVNFIKKSYSLKLTSSFLSKPISLYTNKSIKNRVFEICCSSGNIEIVNELLSLKPPIKIVQNGFEKSCKHGKLDISKTLNGLYKLNCPSHNAIVSMIKHKHNMTFIWAVDCYNISMTLAMFEAACKFGNVDILGRVIQGIITLYPHIIELTIESGQLEVLKFLIRHFKLTFNHFWFTLACKNGQLKIAMWLSETYKFIPEKQHNPLLRACDGGHSSVVSWLLKFDQNITESNNKCFNYAAEKGHLDVMKILYQKDKNIENYIGYNDYYCFRRACSGGHLNVAKWLMQFNPNVHAKNDNALYHSRLNGKSDVVQWLLTLQ